MLIMAHCSLFKMLISVLAVIVPVPLSAAQTPCSCGYTVQSLDHGYALYTEALETDFRHVNSLQYQAYWQPQTYNVSAATGRGLYGKMATTRNVMAIDDIGLQLWVNSTLIDGMVPVAEIVAKDQSMSYGSFRVGMRVTKEPGTCSAFFWVTIKS